MTRIEMIRRVDGGCEWSKVEVGYFSISWIVDSDILGYWRGEIPGLNDTNRVINKMIAHGWKVMEIQFKG